MKTAILIIDMQKDFFEGHERLEKHQVDLIKNCNELNTFGRKHKMPIIWVRQTMKDDLSDAPLYNKKNNKKAVIEGTTGAELLDGLEKKDDDHEIIKKRFSSFFDTHLDELLKSLDIEQLIIAGINTMTCVRTTAIDAYMRDYSVILASDCADGYDIEQHESSLKYLQFSVAETMINQEIFDIL